MTTYFGLKLIDLAVIIGYFVIVALVPGALFGRPGWQIMSGWTK